MAKKTRTPQKPRGPGKKADRPADRPKTKSTVAPTSGRVVNVFAGGRGSKPVEHLATQAGLIHQATHHRKYIRPPHTDQEIQSLLQCHKRLAQRVFDGKKDEDRDWVKEAYRRPDLRHWSSARPRKGLVRPLIGVGIGPERDKTKRLTGRMAIKVYIAENEDEGHRHAEFLSQGLSACAPIQVMASGVFQMLSPSDGSMSTGGAHITRQPLSHCGDSIGNSLGIMAGTLGCKVLLQDGVTKAIVSNAHVLDSEQASAKGKIVQAVQPGRLDGGEPSDSLGRLLKAIWPAAIGTNSSAGQIDAAIAEVGKTPRLVSGDLIGGGQLNLVPPAALEKSLRVGKIGRTTGRTSGFIVDLHGSVTIQYPDPLGEVQMLEQIIIQSEAGNPFSNPGDSGSVVFLLDEFNKRPPIGLLFADNRLGGSSGFTVCCPWGHVQKQLGILRILGGNE